MGETLQILDGGLQERRVVFEATKPGVAALAQQSADSMRSSGVTVIDRKILTSFMKNAFGWFFANGANAVLGSKHGIVLIERDPIGHPEILGPSGTVGIFTEMVVKNFLHVGNEWVFGTARGFWIAIANRGMGVHSAIVEKASALWARVEFPSTGTNFKSFVGFNLAIPIDGLPSSEENNVAWFAGVTNSASYASVLGKFFCGFYRLANRANMLAIQESNAGTKQSPVTLHSLLGKFGFAKSANHQVRLLHMNKCNTLMSRWQGHFGIKFERMAEVA